MTRIKLSQKEIGYLDNFVSIGKKGARTIARANILRMSHQGKTEEDIASVLGICRATVCNIKRRYREEGLESSLNEKPRPGQPPIYEEKHKADIIALSCTTPPEGRKRWSIILLTEELRKSKKFKTINRESVRLILKKRSQTMAEKDVVHSENNARIQRKNV